MVGPRPPILAYFMTTRRDEVYLMGSVPAAAWDSATVATPPREAFVAAFGEFHPDIRRVIEAATEVTVMPICDRERNDRWSGERIVLLGDACHPVRPYMAAGGAMAIEDAAILSRCLATIDETPPRRSDATRPPASRASARCSRSPSTTAGCAGPPRPTGSICYDLHAP